MLTLALSLLAIGISNAAEPGAIAGNWIFTFKADQPVQVLVVLTNDDGKLVADVVDTQPELFDQRQQPVTLKTGTFSSTGKSIALTVLFNDSEAINLDGTLTEDGKLIRGSLKFLGDPDLRVVELRRTKLKKLSDPVAVAQEEFARLEDGQGLFDAGFTIVKNAAESKLSVEEARGIADKMLKAATAYGARWERSVVQQLATQFAKQEGFAEVGLSLAQRAERMLPEGASLPEQMEVMGLVAMALERSGKADDAKKLQANLQRLEIRDAAEYLKTTQTFETPAFAGRKKPSERVVLVELFTGAEDATCLVPTVAVDALQATYKPNDVTVMQYHVPAGGADPLMCKDGLERQLGLFGRIGAPVILVNGRPLGRGAGTGEAKERYQQLCESINEQLELPATAKLTCAITKDGEAYKATAKVTDLEAPGDKVNLRFALVEPKLRYPGSSGVRFHSQTVRAMPGSSKGFPLLKKENEETVTFKLADVKTEHEKFLDEFAKLQSDFPRAERPFALKNLKLVVFIQNDATFEVLNAVTLDLDSK
jgi:hypothetical protein